MAAVTPDPDLQRYIMNPSNQIVSTRKGSKGESIHTYQDGEWVQLNDDYIARDTLDQFVAYLYLETALKTSTVKHKISLAEQRIAYNWANQGSLHLVKYCGEEQPRVGTDDIDNEIKALKEENFTAEPTACMRKLGGQYYVVDTRRPNFDPSVHKAIAPYFRKHLRINAAFAELLPAEEVAKICAQEAAGKQCIVEEFATSLKEQFPEHIPAEKSNT